MWKALEGVPGEWPVSNQHLTLFYQQAHILYLKIPSITFLKLCQSTDLCKKDSNA